MDITTSGTFGVFARLAIAVRDENKPEKRQIIVERFLSRCTAHVATVVVILDCLTAMTTKPATKVAAPGSTEKRFRALLALQSDDPLPTRASGSVLSIRRAHDLACAVGFLGVDKAITSESEAREILSDVGARDAPIFFALCDRDKVSVSGDLTTAEALRCLDDHAAGEFAATKDLERAVSATISNDSPRQLRESLREAFDDVVPIDAAAALPPVPSAPSPVEAIRAVGKYPLPPDGKPLPPCKYGAGCIRKNPQHFLEFSHPSGSGPSGLCTTTAHARTASTRAATSSAVEAASRAIDGVEPLTVLPEYQFVPVDGMGGSYKVKFCGGGTYTCDCPVWRYQNRSTNERTCKHLQQMLGIEYERKRCNLDSAAAMPGVALAHDALRGLGGGGGGGGLPPPPATVKVSMSGVLLANKADHPKVDYTGWWMSEKLDGVRALWNGTCFASRNGNRFDAPAWFTAALPKDVTLDGELFGGRKQFQTTVGIVKSSAGHPGWKTLRFEVFDMPSMGAAVFEARLEAVRKMIPSGPDSYARIVEHVKAASKEHISTFLKKIEDLGGEGVMLRQPNSTYAHTRSNTLLKIKTMHDLDALVIGHDGGGGKHLGRCGALIVKLPNNKQFKVGSGLSDAQRSAPPPVGSIVVVRYQELTDGGVPRFPVFVGVRADGVWPPVA
jgi:DNA ligase-1